LQGISTDVVRQIGSACAMQMRHALQDAHGRCAPICVIAHEYDTLLTATDIRRHIAYASKNSIFIHKYQ